MNKNPMVENAPAVRDGQGRLWHPQIDCGVLRKFERATGVSFFDPVTLAGMVEKRKVADLFDLMYFACHEECEERKVSLDEFASAFTTAEQLKNVGESVVHAMNLFSPSPTSQKTVAESAAPGTGATSIK